MNLDTVLITLSSVVSGAIGALASWWLGRIKPPRTFLIEVEQLDRVLKAAPDRSEFKELERYRRRLLAEAEAWVHPRVLRWRQFTLALPSVLAALGLATASLVGGLARSIEIGFAIVVITFVVCVIAWLLVGTWSSWVSASVEAEVKQQLTARTGDKSRGR